MSDKSKRRYRDYSYVVLNAPIKCPKRGVSADNYPAEHFNFFFEEGLFCIEAKVSGAITDCAPAQIREARRKTDAELAKEAAGS